MRKVGAQRRTFIETSAKAAIGCIATLTVFNSHAAIEAREPAFSASIEPLSRRCAPDLTEQSAREVAQFEGVFVSFSDDDRQINTYSRNQHSSWIYDLTGNEVLNIEDGLILGSSPLLPAFASSALYDREGTKIADIAGNAFLGAALVLENDDYVVTSSFENAGSIIYDKQGQEVAQVEGTAVALNAQGFMTVSAQESITLFYDWNGNELARLNGYTLGSSEGGSYLAATAQTGVHIYDREGHEITVIDGERASFSEQSQRIASTDFNSGGGVLYDLTGGKIADLRGREPVFSADGLWLLTEDLDNRQTYLYEAVSGEAVVTLSTAGSSEFIPDGKALLASGYDGSSFFYDLESGEITQLQGGFQGLSAGSRYIVTRTNSHTYIYDREDNFAVTTLEGSSSSDIFLASTFDVNRYDRDNEQGVLIFSSETRRTHLYDFSGSEVSSFLGASLRFSRDGKWLVTYSEQDDCSRLYKLP